MSDSREPQALPNIRPIRDRDGIAVAVGRRPAPEAVPKVLAKGRGKLARRIIEIAHAAGVKVREDEDLARLLVVLEEGNDIPLEAFEAVAEILNYLYRANGQAAPPAATWEQPS